MPHSRQTIRGAVVTMLTGTTNAGANIYANRETALWSSELPAILVSFTSETAVPEDASNRRFIRTLEMQVKVFAKGNTGLDDSLDTIAQQVENIIAANYSLSGTALGSIYTGTQIEIEADGEVLVGIATLTFDVKYIQ